MNQFYAHSLEGRPTEEWQPLEEHLRNVATMAAEFAKPFGGEEWARIAGLWHDLGKYSDAFQRKLFDANGIESHIETLPGRVVHSQAGGHLATLLGWNGVDRLVSWLIMGHHAGLADFSPDRVGAKALEARMRDPEVSVEILAHAPPSMKAQECPRQRIPAGADPAFFIRMLFSCIVDADFLDTEAFMSKNKARVRQQSYPCIKVLNDAINEHMRALLKRVDDTELNRIRSEVLERCRQAALGKPAVFSLTVPTGGGKTLSSLTFALQHAVEHKKTRIIYVIPYTSIIEQTASVFRRIPGFEDSVIEHHSNVVVDDDSKETSRSRLATENWDAPIIVTTSVQFLESLYAAKTSRCRKLHNITNSVVIFDEAQCLPAEYLRPAIFAIRELHRHYAVTPLLCTATQPSLTRTEQFDFKFREGFDNVVEIVADPAKLARQLKRVEVELLSGRPLIPTRSVDVAAALLRESQSVLCIVNRKEDCRELARLMPRERMVHLSTNMCAEHRFKILSDIRTRLGETDDPFFVISTSLVEAGVDLDFPVVYRAMAGLDSIAQAAGRCNREGKLPLGRTVVFMPENQPVYVRQPAGIASEFLAGDLSDLFSPENYESFFRQRFWQLGEDELDKHGILALLSGRMDYYFRSAADAFGLMQDDWQLPVIAPYGESQELIDNMLEEPWRAGFYMRKLQRYTINIEKRLHGDLVAKEYIHQVARFPGLYTLSPILYDEHFGFISPDAEPNTNPCGLIS